MGTDNPAQRLLELLERGRAIPKERSCRDAWKELLGTSDPALLLERLGKAMALPQVILTAVDEHHPGTSKHHTLWVAQISAAFGQQNLDGKWESFRNHLSPQMISSVGLAATSLAGRGESKRLGEEELSSLRVQVEAIGSSILESDLPAETRRYLLRQVSLLKAAIEEYWLSGGEPITEIVDATFGHIVLHANHREAMGTEVGRKIVSALAVLADAVTVANGLPPLIAATGVPLLQLAKSLLDQSH